MSQALISAAVRLDDKFGQKHWEVITSVGLLLAVCESHYSLLSPCCGASYAVESYDETGLDWEHCSLCEGDRRLGSTVSTYADQCTVELCEEWLASSGVTDPLERTLLAIQLKDELWAVVEPWRRGRTYR